MRRPEKEKREMQKDGMVITIIGCVVLFFLATVIPAYAKEGFFLSVQIPYNNVQGDFDNINAPTVDAGAGLGFIAGYGLTPGFSLELDLSRSNHKVNDFRIRFEELSLNGKYAFLEDAAVQPFLFAGVGSFTLGDDNPTFGGSGYNLGLGMDMYSSPQLSWGIALIRKLITYNKVIKSSDPITMTKNLNGDTTSLRFDVTYHF
jgi:hypothetical protein